jgi:hypothetical protein
VKPGAIVLVHLANPVEKFWGVLLSLESVGLVLRGINLNSFDDWLVALATDRGQDLGLVTMFVPMARVERMFLDERVGEVESYRERVERRAGRDLESWLATR